jgi:hypothetical protein
LLCCFLKIFPLRDSLLQDAGIAKDATSVGTDAKAKATKELAM